ncbi:MAG: LPS export ABC transporter periplasmic protein LptC [Gammaproteobacteria bacterium]|nr:LPS export ABC transporter periplasmic protein LptC [Gammaproteobacteria bacterium]MXW49100.1 LPS export ABC transporter periplasmic protein LptC [Gammaproteobacteria bacterium]MYE51017.1 LPS export ABC transporter periplasmic protein LptC [Gammaproteobacteria bacterium]MYF11754.1 LPS export ABC transporter periplasmic protein LptC [Gammaproteobacteria bacterium]MYF49297.1 LPS export ABC transporter periplasmic protein LptC [Gammaproteobacteria bacterium]
MRQLAAGVLLAVGLLLLAFYLAPWRGTVPPGAPPPELAGEPDIYMESAVINQFQDDGTLQYRLAAQQVRTFDADRHTLLIGPDFSLYSPTAPPWRVSARRGDLHGLRDGADGVLVLSGEVVLHQTDPERGFTTVRTAELRVHPDPRYAETERDVMIETEAGRTFAQGLKADLERRILNLQADADGPVHTIVLPEQIGQ